MTRTKRAISFDAVWHVMSDLKISDADTAPDNNAVDDDDEEPSCKVFSCCSSGEYPTPTAELIGPIKGDGVELGDEFLDHTPDPVPANPKLAAFNCDIFMKASIAAGNG
jgi:hypothetical protein